MSVLIIDDGTRKAIKQLVQYASENICSLSTIKKIVAGEEPPPGDCDLFVLELHLGYCCVYTHDEQPGGICRHISVSVDRPRKFPSPEAVDLIMKEFGFVNNLESKKNYILVDEKEMVINVFEDL